MTEGTAYALYQRLAGPRPWTTAPLLGPWTWAGLSHRSPEELARLWRGMGPSLRSDLLVRWTKPTRTARALGAVPVGTVGWIQGLLVAVAADPGEDVSRVDAWGEHEEWPSVEVAVATTRYHRAVRDRGMGAWVDAVERHVPPPGVQLRVAVVGDRAGAGLVHVIALRDDGLSLHRAVDHAQAAEPWGPESLDATLAELAKRCAVEPAVAT